MGLRHHSVKRTTSLEKTVYNKLNAYIFQILGEGHLGSVGKCSPEYNYVRDIRLFSHTSLHGGSLHLCRMVEIFLSKKGSFWDNPHLTSHTSNILSIAMMLLGH